VSRLCPYSPFAISLFARLGAGLGGGRHLFVGLGHAEKVAAGKRVLHLFGGGPAFFGPQTPASNVTPTRHSGVLAQVTPTNYGAEP